MQVLETGPFTVEELLAHLERDAGSPLDDEVEGNVRGLVGKLDALGLIEPVRS